MPTKRQLSEEEILKHLEETSDLSDAEENDEVDHQFPPNQFPEQVVQISGHETLTEEFEDEEVVDEIEEMEFTTLGIELSHLVDLVPQSPCDNSQSTKIQFTQKKNIVWKNRLVRNQELVVPPNDNNVLETPFQYFQKYFDGKLYFDNYFPSFQLFEILLDRGIYAAGTVRSNRFRNPPLPDQKVLSKRGRGSALKCYSENGKVIFTMWFDNKVVNLASNFVGVGVSDMAKRWDKKTSKYVEINRPEVVRLYNENMGGVDLLDQMLQYYRINIRTSKWTVRVIMHFVDLALTASWMEYKKECEVNGVPQKNILDSLNFRADVANVLIKLQKTDSDMDIPRKGRPSRTSTCPSETAPESSKSTIQSEPLQNTLKRKKLNQCAPAKEVRHDSHNHLPEFLENTNPGRCKMDGCSKKTFITCKKCNVYLCVKRGSNCFVNYHTK